MNILGERIRLRREQIGLNQMDLAVNADIAQSQVSKYEGDVLPRADILIKLAGALDTSVDWLLGLTDDINGIAGKDDLSEAEIYILQWWRSKPADEREVLMRFMKAF